MRNSYELVQISETWNALTIAVIIPVCRRVAVTKPVKSVLDVVETLKDVVLPARMCQSTSAVQGRALRDSQG